MLDTVLLARDKLLKPGSTRQDIARHAIDKHCEPLQLQGIL